MYTKTKMLVISIITIIVLSLGCTSSKDIIPEYIAKKAVMYNPVFSNGEFRVKVEKHKNYPLIKKNERHLLSRVKSIKSILDSVGALRQGRDTIICIANSFATNPYGLHQLVVKTANDTLMIKWGWDGPLESIPEITKWADYFKSLKQTPIYSLLSFSVTEDYYRAIFSWSIPEIKEIIEMIKRNWSGADVDLIRTMRIIIDDGHILEFDYIEYDETIYF